MLKYSDLSIIELKSRIIQATSFLAPRKWYDLGELDTPVGKLFGIGKAPDGRRMLMSDNSTTIELNTVECHQTLVSIDRFLRSNSEFSLLAGAPLLLAVPQSEIATACSSQGLILFNRKTGEVLHVLQNSDSDDEYFPLITKFDVKEYEKTYGQEVFGDIDILDLGYWYGRDEKYEEPAHDWRSLISLSA